MLTPALFLSSEPTVTSSSDPPRSRIDNGLASGLTHIRPASHVRFPRPAVSISCPFGGRSHGLDQGTSLSVSLSTRAYAQPQQRHDKARMQGIPRPVLICCAWMKTWLSLMSLDQGQRSWFVDRNFLFEKTHSMLPHVNFILKLGNSCVGL